MPPESEKEPKWKQSIPRRFRTNKYNRNNANVNPPPQESREPKAMGDNSLDNLNIGRVTPKYYVEERPEGRPRPTRPRPTLKPPSGTTPKPVVTTTRPDSHVDTDHDHKTDRGDEFSCEPTTSKILWRFFFYFFLLF